MNPGASEGPSSALNGSRLSDLQETSTEEIEEGAGTGEREELASEVRVRDVPIHSRSGCIATWTQKVAGGKGRVVAWKNARLWAASLETGCIPLVSILTSPTPSVDVF